MRVFELTTHMKAISRADGRSATAAAAYRACAVIECDREGRTHDYSRKQGLEASEIALPAGAPTWAADRARLWNEAELRERNGSRGKNAGAFKADAKIARETLFSFPAELSAAGRLNAARAIARHLADAHGVAADFAIHQPGKEGDHRNHHCHLMMTTRRLTAKGLGEKAREWDDLRTGPALARQLRAFIAQTLNDELKAEDKASLVFVEHRSFKDRGSGQKPTRHQGPGRTAIARKERRQARDSWQAGERKGQHERHAKERAGLKVRQDFALQAKSGDLAERERAGIEAIRAELQASQAADVKPKGASRLFQVVTGQAMRADFEREARHAERAREAEKAVAALKVELRAERNAFVAGQVREKADLADRHKGEDRQLAEAASARHRLDLAAERQARRHEVGRTGHEREGPELGISRGPEP